MGAGGSKPGDEKLQGLLDAYGKLHRITLSDGHLCFKAAMMDTIFYNVSGDVWASSLKEAGPEHCSHSAVPQLAS